MTNTDARLVAAYKKIDAGEIDVLAVDIFDTLLWRKVPLPVDVFLILGKKLKEEGWLIEAVPYEAFVEMRVRAESLARLKKGGAGEITLKEIYWLLSGIFNRITIEQMVQGVKGIINESDVDDLAAMEVALEKQLNQIDFNIISLLEYAHKKNVRTVLISDTYFERSQLEFILERSPLFQASTVDKIFISCEVGRGKRQGLFNDVLEEMRVDPHKMLHIGDNLQSDYAAALKEGIDSIYYLKCGEEISQILDIEWPKGNLKVRERLLDQEQGDFGLTSLRAKLTHCIAYRQVQQKDAFYWQYGATALGPFLVGFAHWVYRRCQEMDQKRVFCLMREGRLYANLIKQCASIYPNTPIETTELWASRRFISHACIVYGNPNELLAVCYCHPASPFNVENFLAYLGLDIEKIPKWLEYRYVVLSGEELPEKLAKYLCNHQALREQILHNALIKRQRFFKYLTSLVDLRLLSQMTIVDIGWAGTIQGSLQMLFQLWGYPIRVHGLYLGTIQHTASALLQGHIREGYLLKAGYPSEIVPAVRRGIYPIEQTATAGLGPLVDIDVNGNLVFGKKIVYGNQIRQAYVVQQGIYAFCQLLGQYIQAGAIKWDPLSTQLTDQLREIFIRTTTYPTKQEATRLASWHHDHVSGRTEDTKYALGNDEYYENMIQDMLPQAAFEDWGMTWPVAYAAKKEASLVRMAQAARMEIIPKKCFLSLDSLPFKVFIDKGKGFPKKPDYREELRSNANRHFFAFVKLNSLKKTIRKLRFEIHSSSSIIRIRSLRLVIYDKGLSSVVRAVFFESNSEETNIEFLHAIQLEPGIFLSNEGPLVLTYMCETSDVYAVQINFCCEIFQGIHTIAGPIS